MQDRITFLGVPETDIIYQIEADLSRLAIMADMPPSTADNPSNSSSSDSDHEMDEGSMKSRASSLLSEPPSSPIDVPADNLPTLRSRSNRQAPTAASDLENEGGEDEASTSLAEDGEDDGGESDDSFSLASGKRRKASAKKGKHKGKKTKRVKRDGQTKSKKQIKEEQAELKRKSRLAKVAVCRDLPDWGDRKDVPLMKLPNEILDRCFGTCRDLTVSGELIL